MTRKRRTLSIVTRVRRFFGARAASPVDLFELGARFDGLAKVPIAEWRRRDRDLARRRLIGGVSNKPREED